MGVGTNLLQNLEPDVLGPVRSNDGHHQCLQLDVAEDDVTVHADAGSGGGFTVEVTGADQVVQTRLQGELEVGAKSTVSFS